MENEDKDKECWIKENVSKLDLLSFLNEIGAISWEAFAGKAYPFMLQTYVDQKK